MCLIVTRPDLSRTYGLPIALAANQLGHSDPAMTARVHLGRKGSTAAAAAVLLVPNPGSDSPDRLQQALGRQRAI